MAKRVKRPPVDWDNVPVIITGTPNPDAIKAIVRSIREFELRQMIESASPELKQEIQDKVAAEFEAKLGIVVERGSISS